MDNLSENTEDENQVGIIDINRTLHHPKTTEHTFFARIHGTLIKIDRSGIFWAMGQVSINLKGSETYKICPLSSVELNEESITERLWKTSKLF